MFTGQNLRVVETPPLEDPHSPLGFAMTMLSRPTPLPATVLDEIVCDHFHRRFAACRAVERTIWGLGLQMCSTPVERAAWQAQYRSHLEKLCIVWAYGGLEPEQP